MDHNELARRMGVTTTGSSSHSDKSRMHLKEGGPAVTKIYSPMSSARKLGENGAGRLKPRVEASIGGDMLDMGKRMVRSGADYAGRKLKAGAKEGVKYAKAGVKEGVKYAKAGAEDVARKAKSGLESLSNKARETLDLSHGGCAGRKKAAIGGDIKGAGMAARKGLEDLGRKAKAALHLADGGEASMNSEMPVVTTRKVTKTIRKGAMPSKPAKQIARGSIMAKTIKPIAKE